MSDNEFVEEEFEATSQIEGKRTRRQAAKIDENVIWSKEMVFKLIAAVEEFVCIWDARCNEYRDLTKRTAAWQRIEEDTFENAIPFEQLKVCSVLCPLSSACVHFDKFSTLK